MGSDSQDIQQHIGCGSDINLSQLTLNINTTTGGSFSVIVDSHTRVENLKKIVAKKLKVAKDRICLLHREKELHDGTSIKENGIMDGSKIILLPNVETGLLAQRPENTVMQALESLNDSQVNDFLTGKTPLNLSMRLGDHMMLIQLQLSTVNPTNSSASTSVGSSGSVNSSRTRSIFRSKTSSSARPSVSMVQQSSSTNSTPTRFTNANHMYKSLSSDQLPEKYRTRHETLSPQPSTSRATASELIESKNEFEELRTVVSSLKKEKIETKTSASINNGDIDMETSLISTEELRTIVSSLEKEKIETKTSASIYKGDVDMDTSLISTEGDALLEQSPIKSLSNLVSGPIKTSSLKHIPMSTPTATTTAKTTNTTNTSNKITSCLCKSVENGNTSASGCDTNCQYSRTRHQLQHKKYVNHPELKTATRSSTLLHKTLNNPIAKTKSAGFQSIQSARAATTSDAYATILRRSKSTGNISHAEQGIAEMVAAKSLHNELIDTTAGSAVETISDTLAEASRNLTKTLRKLSKEVFSSKGETSAIAVSEEKRVQRPTTNNTTPTNASSALSHQTSSSSTSNTSSSTVAGFGSGAVIESMRNHGRGIYSGTFSGTLNPALQDRYGRPKRDISTVIHILNDLLSATPHYSRGARISFEPAHSSRKYSSSSKRISSSSGSGGSIQSQRAHCSKCTASSSSKSGCNADCHKSSGSHHRNTSRHIYVTNDSAQPTTSKSTSLPTTPVAANTSIDCRQCQMPMSNSAPVTPTASPDQSMVSSNTTLDTSNSNAFDFHNSTGDLSMSSTLSSSSSSPLSSSSSPLSASQDASVQLICTKCSNMEIENNKTKTKLDQLRLVMQQRRERREARKMRSAPYGGRIIGAAQTNTITASATNSPNSNDGSNATNVIQATVEAPPTNPIVEQVNTLA